jgi:hypothetical protein
VLPLTASPFAVPYTVTATAGASVARIFALVDGATRTFAEFNVYIVVGAAHATLITGGGTGVELATVMVVPFGTVFVGIAVGVAVTTFVAIFVACFIFAFADVRDVETLWLPDVAGPQPASIKDAIINKRARQKRGYNFICLCIKVLYFRNHLSAL